jgi:hypothetical protein
MQYRTPGRTVTIELSAGHSRTGAAGCEVFSRLGASQPPLAPALHAGGVANGRSIRGPRSDQPTAKPPAKSTIENNVISPAAPKPMAMVSDPGEPALAVPLNPRHALGSGRPIPHLDRNRRPAIDARECGCWPLVHVEAVREISRPLSFLRVIPGNMASAATLGAD